MSEREPQINSPEQSVEVAKEAAERSREAAEFREREAAKAEAEKPSFEKINEQLKEALEKQKPLRHEQQESSSSGTGHYASTGLRSHALNTTVKRTQRQLSGAERTFSKVIHQPAVDAVSNAAEATVARPYSLLVGGLFSAAASLAVLYICRHYGYEYNFLIGLASFAGGFVLGLVAEGLYRLFKRLTKS
jgi:cobalamin biosynthesis Mg chelatase CobN